MGAQESKSSEDISDDVRRNRVLSGLNLDRMGKRLVEGERNRQEEDGLVFTKYSDSEVYIVLSGTLEKLVESLYDPRFKDDAFLSEFVLNYSVFSDTLTLVHMLIENYKVSSTFERINLVQVFCRWFELDSEMRANAAVADTVVAFVDEAISHTSNTALEDSLYKLAEAAVRPNTEDPEPQPTYEAEDEFAITSSAANLVSLSYFGPAFALTCAAFEKNISADREAAFAAATPREIAVEMTLAVHELFAKVRPIECLHGAFNIHPERTPNMTKWTRYNEHMKNLIITSIITKEETEARAAEYSRFTYVANECMALNNFNDAMTIWMTLTATPALLNLKKTRNLLKADVTESLETLANVLNPSARVPGREDLKGSFIAYHYALAEAHPPCVPSQYIVADNLFKMNFGRKDKLPNGHIDFGKLRDMGKIISNMVTFQRQTYFLSSNSELKEFLLHSPVIVEEAVWNEISHKLEPPQMKRARRNSFFGFGQAS